MWEYKWVFPTLLYEPYNYTYIRLDFHYNIPHTLHKLMNEIQETNIKMVLFKSPVYYYKLYLECLKVWSSSNFKDEVIIY
jgi:hypothetical protein